MGVMAEIEAATLAAGAVAVWWLGQSGYMVKTPGGTTVAIDPYLSDSRSDGGRHIRRFPPPIAPDDLRCDAIFCTHDHPDHADPETLLPALRNCDAPVIGSPSVCDHLVALGVASARLQPFSVGDAYAVGSDLAVTATFALHGPPAPADRLPGRPVFDPIGLQVTCGPVRFYHAGDTLLDERLFAVVVFAPQTVFLPVNGRGGNMNAREAAELTRRLAPAVAVPMHYGSIAQNDADPQAFVDAVRELGVPTRVVLLEAGRRYDLTGEGLHGSSP